MNNQKIADIIRLMLIPGLLVAFGIVLLVNPDSASRLISSILGWVLMMVGILHAISAITDTKKGTSAQSAAARNGTVAVVCIILGSFLCARPLVLAAVIGCVAGAVLLLAGLRQLKTGINRIDGILKTVSGVILILLPMTTSRLVFRICGIAMLLFGGLMIYANLRDGRRNPPDDGIVDV